MEINGEIMVVSQFTLYGMLKGNKPDFHSSMDADKAK
jgi:D-tyrosyl-tRNA(Tyr) deacylase